MIEAQADEIGRSPRHALSPLKVGMLTFLLTEVAFFGTLIMTYLFFLNQTTASDPSPRQVFRLPLVLLATAILFSSSATIHLAEKAMHRDERGKFLAWWGLTIALGMLFLTATAIEWNELINHWGLTIHRNLFGTTYFTLVGFHALHVTAGIVIMAVIFGLAQRRRITSENAAGVEVASWYWHFVDGVWAVVFLLVYVVGR